MENDKGKTVTVPGWLELKISLGNIVAAGLFLVTSGIWYARMDGRMTSTELAQAKAELVYVRKDVVELEQKALALRLEDLKSQLDRVEKKLDSIR